MNKAAFVKHEIYNKLIGFSEKDLHAIASFIDFMRHQSGVKEDRKLFRMEGILQGYDIDFTKMTDFRQQSWQHLEKEFDNE